MTKSTVVKHPIQKYILSVLVNRQQARFRDLRPARVESNLYSYHLKLLRQNQYVVKTKIGNYTLGPAGIRWAHQLARTQDQLGPRVDARLVLQNDDGDVLLIRRRQQPFIDSWDLPSELLSQQDGAIADAAQRLLSEQLQLVDARPYHAGDCYIRLRDDQTIITSSLNHVFYIEVSQIANLPEHFGWFRPHKLSQQDLAPAVEAIVARTFFRDRYFFEEYIHDC